MELKLTKKPKGVTILNGFPGIGLIGTISTEFLMEHLKFEQIGKIIFTDAPAVVAIHKGKLIEPLGVYHSKAANLVVIHGINLAYGNEWELAKILADLYKKLEAKEMISVEGVGAQEQEINESVEDGTVFYFANKPGPEKKLKNLKINKLEDGIIMGITSALIVSNENMPLTCFFAKTHSKLPDSKAAAQIIKALDGYIGLDVDYKPLLETAQQFEHKIKEILQKGKAATDLRDLKKLSYLG